MLELGFKIVEIIHNKIKRRLAESIKQSLVAYLLVSYNFDSVFVRRL